ncbi:MAG TPA: plastocyanin/azurin family copper-binding protein [Dehalococcoidia bacterium]
MKNLASIAALTGLAVALLALAVACGGGGGGETSSGGADPSDPNAAARARVATAQAEQTAAANAAGGARATAIAATAAATSPSASLEITAKEVKFDKLVLVAPANATVTVRLIIDETGVFAGERHNLAIFRDQGMTEKIFVGELDAATLEYRFTTPGPGTYYFFCSPHLDSMNGAFIVR